MRKRERFLLVSGLLAIGLFVIQLIPLDFRLFASFLFFFITYGFSAWALHEDIQGVEWLTVVPFPSFYAVSVSLFYFLLPENILSKIAILGIFGVGMYALYLTANIYSVAKIRTIQLLRAAHAVGLFMTLLSTVLFTNTIFSYRLPFWANMVTVFVATFPLVYMFFWSIDLRQSFDRYMAFQAGCTALLLAEVAGALSFLPATTWWSSLIITTLVYVILGLQYNKQIGRLFRNTTLEYVAALGMVFLAFFVLLQWR